MFCRDIILKMKTPSKSKSKKSKGAKWDGIREAKYLQNKESKTKAQNSIDAVFDELHEEEEEPTVICEGTRSSGYMMMEEQIEEYKPIGKYVAVSIQSVCGWQDNRLTEAGKRKLYKKMDAISMMLKEITDKYNDDAEFYGIEVFSDSLARGHDYTGQTVRDWTLDYILYTLTHIPSHIPSHMQVRLRPLPMRRRCGRMQSRLEKLV